MLVKTNSFRMRYGFVQQTLDVCKTNALMILKIIIMLNTHLHILEKCNNTKFETLTNNKTALSIQAIISRKRLDVYIRKISITG